MSYIGSFPILNVVFSKHKPFRYISLRTLFNFVPTMIPKLLHYTPYNLYFHHPCDFYYFLLNIFLQKLQNKEFLHLFVSTFSYLFSLFFMFHYLNFSMFITKLLSYNALKIELYSLCVFHDPNNHKWKSSFIAVNSNLNETICFFP